jgi:glucokinase
LRIAGQSLSGVWYTKLEDVASGWGIENEARTQAEIRGRDEGRILVEIAGESNETLQAIHVARAAMQNDLVAQEVLNSAWTHLAEAICHAIALLCPRRIVIGGGVSLMGDELLFRPLRKLVAERVFKPFADCYDIVPAALGEEVVVHGALALARQRLSE